MANIFYKEPDVNILGFAGQRVSCKQSAGRVRQNFHCRRSCKCLPRPLALSSVVLEIRKPNIIGCKATIKSHWPISEAGTAQQRTFPAMDSSDPISCQALGTLRFMIMDSQARQECNFPPKREAPHPPTLHLIPTLTVRQRRAPFTGSSPPLCSNSLSL